MGLLRSLNRIFLFQHSANTKHLSIRDLAEACGVASNVPPKGPDEAMGRIGQLPLCRVNQWNSRDQKEPGR